MLVCWGLAARWFVGVGTRVGGATEYAPPGATIGGECATAVRASVRAPGTCIRYGHSGLRARLGGVCRCAPGFRRPGFRPGRAGYVPFGPGGPVGRAYSIRPYTVTCIRVPGQIRRRPQTPILPGDGCRDCRRRHRAFRVSYRPRPASWDLSASRHRASSVPSVPWAAWDPWDPSAA